MSIKKELLCKLNEQQLKELAQQKGITFKLSDTQKKYYTGWDEKDKIIDLMTDHKDLSITDIEQYLTK
jgi:hypothetical protein